MRSKYPKAGRPCRGDRKRVRKSFTLHPLDAFWLRETAVTQHKSMSEVLDQILEEKRLGAEKDVVSYIRDIPYSKTEISEFCKKNKITMLSLFGSILTDPFNSESDIDFLVKFEMGFTPSLFGLVELEKKLSQLLGGRLVDLRTENELSRYFRTEVLKKAHILYAA